MRGRSRELEARTLLEKAFGWFGYGILAWGTEEPGVLELVASSGRPGGPPCVFWGTREEILGDFVRRLGSTGDGAFSGGDLRGISSREELEMFLEARGA